MWGSQEKILGHKVNEKIFRVDPGRKKSKKVNKILFPFPFPFPVIPKNGGLWFPFPNFGNGFFHSLPVPEFWEWIFFIPFPFPNFGNGIFSFPSHSRNLGMDFFIPFPFPNFGNGLFQFLSLSRTLGMEFSIPVPAPEPSKVIIAHPWFRTFQLQSWSLSCRCRLNLFPPTFILKWFWSVMIDICKDDVNPQCTFERGSLKFPKNL